MIEADFAGAFNMNRSDQRNLSGTLNLPDSGGMRHIFSARADRYAGRVRDERTPDVLISTWMPERPQREMLATVDNVYR
ncbi:MAG: hypothetical protein H6978_03420 [Gammaproteobacteria bacterium]|nr:hypothetical protein [Gammaproteobacteria bacterium]